MARPGADIDLSIEVSELSARAREFDEMCLIALAPPALQGPEGVVDPGVEAGGADDSGSDAAAAPFIIAFT